MKKNACTLFITKPKFHHIYVALYFLILSMNGLTLPVFNQLKCYRKKQRKRLTNIINFVQLSVLSIDLSPRHANISHIKPGSFIQLRELLFMQCFLSFSRSKC